MASLSRVYQMLQDHDVAFISAYRENYTPEENKKRTKQLKTLIRQFAFGYNQIEGHWKNLERGKESLFVSFAVEQLNMDSERFLKSITALAKKFNQQAIIYYQKGGENGFQVDLLTGKQTRLSAFHPNKVSASYSKIKGIDRADEACKGTRYYGWIGTMAGQSRINEVDQVLKLYALDEMTFSISPDKPRLTLDELAEKQKHYGELETCGEKF